MNPPIPCLAFAINMICERVQAQQLFQETEQITIYALSSEDCLTWGRAAALTRGVN